MNMPIQNLFAIGSLVLAMLLAGTLLLIARIVGNIVNAWKASLSENARMKEEITGSRNDNERLKKDLAALQADFERRVSALTSEKPTPEQNRDREGADMGIEPPQRGSASSKDRAEQASEAKSNFLANMSNEIRTSMNGVLGMAALLLQGELNIRQRKQAQTLLDSAEALRQILDDILDFPKIEAGKLELEVSDFDLRSVMEGVADLLAFRAQEKGLELLCFIDPPVPTRLRGDPIRLRQILVNLVSNAIKFTQAGEVSFTAKLERIALPPVIRFEVIDTGDAIPKEKQHLFEPFSQADTSAAGEFPGTGLGFSIVRQLVMMMGGQLGVESEPEKRARFWFTVALPMQQGAQRQNPPSLPGHKILVIDENAACGKLVMQFLAFWRCQAEYANSADAGLARLKSERRPYEALIADLKTITEKEQAIIAAGVPVILMTHVIDAANLEHWKQQGFAGRIPKPVKQIELGSCLALVLGCEPAPQQPAASNKSVPAQPKQDRTQFRLLLVEDNSVNQEVAMAMLKHFGYSADVANNGKEALAALEAKDYDLVLMDCQMPELDGYEATRLIRDPHTRVRNRKIPVIAMTAHAMRGDREKCLSAGMDDFVPKPIQTAALEEILDRWTAKRPIPKQESRPAHRPVEESKEAISSSSAFDYDGLLERLMGNEVLAKRVLTRFVEDTPQQLAALANAIQNADSKAAHLHAHSIKGAAANIGGVSMAATAKKLEDLGNSGDLSNAQTVYSELSSSFEHLRPLLEKTFLMP